MSVPAVPQAPADTVPRGALLAVGALLIATVGGAAAARLTASSAPAAAPVAVTAADLRFADRPDGAIRVSDAGGATVGVVAPGTGGFVRGVMRGLARDRRSRGLDAAVPFRLSRDAAGRLWLQDPATGRLVDLEAFGADNRAAFAAFLPKGPRA